MPESYAVEKYGVAADKTIKVRGINKGLWAKSAAQPNRNGESVTYKYGDGNPLSKMSRFQSVQSAAADRTVVTTGHTVAVKVTAGDGTVTYENLEFTAKWAGATKWLTGALMFEAIIAEVDMLTSGFTAGVPDPTGLGNVVAGIPAGV